VFDETPEATPSSASGCYRRSRVPPGADRGRRTRSLHRREGAGHNIFETEPELVLETIDEILEATKPG